MSASSHARTSSTLEEDAEDVASVYSQTSVHSSNLAAASSLLLTINKMTNSSTAVADLHEGTAHTAMTAVTVAQHGSRSSLHSDSPRLPRAKSMDDVSLSPHPTLSSASLSAYSQASSSSRQRTPRAVVTRPSRFVEHLDFEEATHRLVFVPALAARPTALRRPPTLRTASAPPVDAPIDMPRPAAVLQQPVRAETSSSASTSRPRFPPLETSDIPEEPSSSTARDRPSESDVVRPTAAHAEDVMKSTAAEASSSSSATPHQGVATPPAPPPRPPRSHSRKQSSTSTRDEPNLVLADPSTVSAAATTSQGPSRTVQPNGVAAVGVSPTSEPPASGSSGSSPPLPSPSPSSTSSPQGRDSFGEPNDVESSTRSASPPLPSRSPLRNVAAISPSLMDAVLPAALPELDDDAWREKKQRPKSSAVSVASSSSGGAKKAAAALSHRLAPIGGGHSRSSSIVDESALTSKLPSSPAPSSEPKSARTINFSHPFSSLFGALPPPPPPTSALPPVPGESGEEEEDDGDDRPTNLPSSAWYDSPPHSPTTPTMTTTKTTMAGVTTESSREGFKAWRRLIPSSNRSGRNSRPASIIGTLPPALEDGTAGGAMTADESSALPVPDSFSDLPSMSSRPTSPNAPSTITTTTTTRPLIPRLFSAPTPSSPVEATGNSAASAGGGPGDVATSEAVLGMSHAPLSRHSVINLSSLAPRVQHKLTKPRVSKSEEAKRAKRRQEYVEWEEKRRRERSVPRGFVKGVLLARSD